MAARIHELRQQYSALVAKANAALEAARTKAKAENRALSAEETAADDAFQAQIEAMAADIKLEERAIERAKASGAPSAPVAGSGPQRESAVDSVRDRVEDDPRRGFRTHREFLMSVMENSGLRSKDQITDDRLKPLALADKEDKKAGGELAYLLPNPFAPQAMQAAVGSDEQGNYSNAHGGFLGNGVTRLPGLLSVDFEGDPTAGRTRSVPMATTTVEIPARVDKNHTSSVSGGFTVARKAETAAATASRMSMELVTMRATSLFGFAYATEELLADSPITFAALIDAGFREQFGAHLLNEKLRGLGDGEYLGILNADCTVSVSKESNQLADTIVTQNLLKMKARCWGYGKAVWIANQDTIPQLGVLSVGVGTAGALVYQPSMREDLPDTLLGRPIFYSEYAATLGDAGDIILANFSEYLEGLYQPMQSAESIHVRFANHERAFKLWVRNAGQPWWRSALTPAKSSATLSPFVTLAARA